MTPELEQRIFEKYPLIFEGRRALGTPKWGIWWGITCEDGWFDVVDGCSAEVDAYARAQDIPVKVHQVKEKFGTLRYYIGASWNSHSIAEWTSEQREGLDQIITRWDRLSEVTCEFCGKSGASLTSSELFRWIRTLCPECTAGYPANWEKVREARFKQWQEEWRKEKGDNTCTE